MAKAMQTRELVTALKAAAEPTRLRILLLLAAGELNVKDLTEILGQSQPRISRHLKLLFEAGLIERFREGSWAYFHVSDRTEGGRLALAILALADAGDSIAQRDRERADRLKRERELAAQNYFRQHAEEWDRIRSLHVAEGAVEAAMRQALGAGPFGLLLDLGTGTGRTLELFADRYERGLGLDTNQTMLAVARANLAKAGLDKAQVRHGDIYDLPLAEGVADAVIIHQVLHYLAEPAQAIREAARVMAPGARLLIVDFAAHDLEFLRKEHAHERLGFEAAEVTRWCEEAGLAGGTPMVLGPSSGDRDQLTVVLWTADKPAGATVPGQTKTRIKALQETR